MEASKFRQLVCSLMSLSCSCIVPDGQIVVYVVYPSMLGRTNLPYHEGRAVVGNSILLC